MRVFGTLGVFVVLAIGSTAAVATPAGAATPTPPEPAVSADLGAKYGVTPAELDDLRFYAAQEGVPLVSMLERFGGSSQFTAAVNDLRAGAPEGFVYAEWGNGSGTIIVRPGYATAAAGAMSNHAARAKVTEHDLLSESAREALAERVGSALNASGVVVDVDPLGGGVNVEITTSSTVRADLAKLSSAQADAAAAGLKLNITHVASAPTPAARGGVTYGNGYCTGGFVVRSGTTYGISTANHCTYKPTIYDGSTTGTSTALSNRDVRWTRFTSGSPSRTFQSNVGVFTSATSSGDPVPGSPVCKFGVTTGKSCDTVESTGYCITYDGYPQFCGLIKTVNSHVGPGDSGGPWYYGNTARGVTSGRVAPEYDLFSGIGSLNLLSLTVYTG